MPAADAAARAGHDDHLAVDAVHVLLALTDMRVTVRAA